MGGNRESRAARAGNRTNVRRIRNPRHADYGHLNQLIGYHLRLVQIITYDRIFRGLTGGGSLTAEFTPARYAALVIVDANRGLSQSELGRALGIARSGAMTMIDWFEQRGLMQRKAHPTDKRSHALWPTQAGIKLLARLNRIFDDADRSSFEALNPSECAALQALLIKTLRRA